MPSDLILHAFYHLIGVSWNVYEARWNNRKDFMVFANTLKGAIELMFCHLTKEDVGTIYVYKNGMLVSKSKAGRISG